MGRVRIANNGTVLWKLKLGIEEMARSKPDGYTLFVGNVGTLGRGMQVTVLGTDDSARITLIMKDR